MTFIEVSRIWIISQFDGLTLPVQSCKSWSWLDQSLFTFPQCYNNSPIGATKTLWATRTSTQSHKALVIFGDMRVPASINQDVLNCFDRSMGSVFCFEGVRWNGGLLMSVKGNTEPRVVGTCLSHPFASQSWRRWCMEHRRRGFFLSGQDVFFGPILEGFQWIWQLRWEHACCFPGRAVEFKKFKMKPEIHPKGER